MIHDAQDFTETARLLQSEALSREVNAEIDEVITDSINEQYKRRFGSNPTKCRPRTREQINHEIDEAIEAQRERANRPAARSKFSTEKVFELFKRKL